jgi:IMP and pyridine-specific 5'-nucleotidase
VRRSEWLLDEMKSWKQEDITQLLDIAESSLRACAANLNLPVAVLRKDRAVGVYPYDRSKIHREQLEETVLVVQNTVERSVVGSRLPFCAFNGIPLPFLSPISFFTCPVANADDRRK